MSEKSDGLAALLRESAGRVAAMTPEQREEMFEEQRQSWVRGMTARCEHGVLDFEQCPECRKEARHE